MNFFDAVLYGFKKYRQTSGRCTRAEYWYFIMFFLIVLLLTGFVDRLLGTYFISAIFTLAMLPPIITASIRRLQDTDRSAAHMLVVLIPGLGLIFLLICLAGQGTLGANVHGINPEYSGKQHIPEGDM